MFTKFGKDMFIKFMISKFMFTKFTKFLPCLRLLSLETDLDNSF